MIRPKDKAKAAQLDAALVTHSAQVRPLVGIANPTARLVLVEQFLESLHRVQYIAAIKSRPISAMRADPTSDIFDPIRAAIFHAGRGEADEAFWLLFLATHFGRHPVDGWRLARDVYGGVPQGQIWTWDRVSTNPGAFRQWLEAQLPTLKGDGIKRRFSNHRKYESLSGLSANGTGAAVESYVDWVGPARSHKALVGKFHNQAAGDPTKLFDLLYESMDDVRRFGRLAKFDHLAMLGKVGLVPITPGRTYLSGATGPLAGARLLFGLAEHENSASVIEGWLVDLDRDLQIGSQPMEDAICNWQKSPTKFVPFR